MRKDDDIRSLVLNELRIAIEPLSAVMISYSK
jgi:hypothetical protein